MSLTYEAKTKQAYELLHNGVLAFSRMEAQGMCIDVDFCIEEIKRLSSKIEETQNDLQTTNFFKRWEHTIGKGKVNIYSNAQLSYYLYKVLKLTPIKFTSTSTDEEEKGATDNEALQALNIPELQTLLQIRKYKKIRDTYLTGFMREQVDGIVHSSFNLGSTKTFRPCIAKGTKILVTRDFEKYPDGIPIEQVKAGDYVYCFDNMLHPAIRKVLWAGKTGHDEVVRVHYSRKKKGKGHLDVTPEHLIRLIHGEYVQAQNLENVDHRLNTDSKYAPKIRALSCKRVGDKLQFSGHLINGQGIREHRFIYEHFKGALNKLDIIHHKNGRHLDHSLSNLKRMNRIAHSKQHAINAPEEIKKKRIAGLRKGSVNITHKVGAESPNSLNLSKFTCLRLLAKAKGCPTKVAYDFDTFKKYLQLHNIDWKEVQLRYTNNGKYISRWYLQQLHAMNIGRAKIQKLLGVTHYTLLKLYNAYDIDTTRKWGNQFGEFKPGNHVITKIEWINKVVDLYDLRIEEFNNFFANEICVHNSTDSPNLANIPKRDKEMMYLCRRGIIPRKGYRLIEYDYSGIEVKMACCYTEDQKLIDDTLNGDMHKDMAIELYMLDGLNKKHTGENNFRQGAKNAFVFPEFYGDYYIHCVDGLLKWAQIAQLENGMKGLEHLSNKGLIKLDKAGKIKNKDNFTEHVKKVENLFWNDRYRKYTKWKKRTWETYQRKGYIDMFTGFRCSGVMRKNEALNISFQGSAFHCLLWSLIQIDSLQSSKNWNSRLVNQIYDAFILDQDPNEHKIIDKAVQRIATEDIRKEWKWIIIPLALDTDIKGVDEPWSGWRK